MITFPPHFPEGIKGAILNNTLEIDVLSPGRIRCFGGIGGIYFAFIRATLIENHYLVICFDSTNGETENSGDDLYPYYEEDFNWFRKLYKDYVAEHLLRSLAGK